jgi:hypothetical protein
MSKFKAGDRVVVVGIRGENGRRGEVTDPEANDSWPVEVSFDDAGLGLCTEDELEFEHIYDALSAKPAVQVFGGEESGLIIDMSKSQGIFLDAIKVDSRPEDVVNHPSHYTWLPNGLEVIDVTAAFSFVRGNALKYLMRADHKGRTLEDLKKARWYIDYEIRQLEGPGE